MKYIVLNFAYGTGPYLRTTELAMAFNNEMEKRGREHLGIIVPWVYGEKQKKVMLEEFSGHENKYPGEILLDRKLGAVLKKIFYGDCSYEEALRKLVGSYKKISAEAHHHLAGKFAVETLGGKKIKIEGGDIGLELSRSPRISYNIAPAAYFTSFGYVEDILEKASAEGKGKIAVKKKLLKRGAKVAGQIESGYKIHCISYPATFSWQKKYIKRYKDEIMVPPIGPVPSQNDEVINTGIFATITGIPGLEHLYQEVRDLGLKIYSNETKAVPGSIYFSPHIIANNNILLQFARSGWSSIWASMITGTPLVTPDFHPKDDPEIYFNRKAVEALGLGIVYRGQVLDDVLKLSGSIKTAGQKMRDKILKRWNTLDGNSYCAKIFVDDYIKSL